MDTIYIYILCSTVGDKKKFCVSHICCCCILRTSVLPFEFKKKTDIRRELSFILAPFEFFSRFERNLRTNGLAIIFFTPGRLRLNKARLPLFKGKINCGMEGAQGSYRNEWCAAQKCTHFLPSPTG